MLRSATIGKRVDRRFSYPGDRRVQTEEEETGWGEGEKRGRKRGGKRNGSGSACHEQLSSMNRTRQR